MKLYGRKALLRSDFCHISCVLTRRTAGLTSYNVLDTICSYYYFTKYIYIAQDWEKLQMR